MRPPCASAPSCSDGRGASSVTGEITIGAAEFAALRGDAFRARAFWEGLGRTPNGEFEMGRMADMPLICQKRRE